MIFRRSLSKELISTAAGIFLILLGIVLAQRTEYLILLASKGLLPNDAITTMLVFNMVKFLPMLLSLTLFLTILMTLSRWYRDSEMIVWFNAGLSINSLVSPIIRFSIPIIIFISILSLFTMPWATKQGEDYRIQLESRDDLAFISPGVFKESAHSDLLIFVESFDELGNVFKNIFVQSIQHKKLGIIVAQKGNRITEYNGDNFLVMHNGRRYEGSPNSAEFSTTEFDKYAIRVKPAELKQELVKTISKSTIELLRNKSKANSAELHWRIAIPISTCILVFFAIPLSSVDPRAERSLNIALAIIIYIIYNNSLSIFQALITQGKVNDTVGLWPIHLLFATLAGYIFYRHEQQLPFLPIMLVNKWSKLGKN